MQAIDRTRLAVLMVFHLLWGAVLWLSISKLGLGLSTDSVHLLFAGTNLAAGRGLISFDGAPVVAWPPLYSGLLAALHLSGLSAFAAAHVLQGLSFLGLSICLSLLFLRIFLDDFPMALTGTILSNVGIVVVAGFVMVGSDYLHLFLVVLCALLTALYIDQPSGRLYVAIFIAAMLAMLQRYLGVAVIAMAMLSILAWHAAPLKQRLLRGLFLGLAALPASVWLLLTSPLVTRRPAAPLARNFDWFSNAILGWFLPPEELQAHPVFYLTLIWIILALIALALWIGRKALPPFALPILLVGLLYPVALFGSASVAYYNRLEGRFLLPLYIPFIVALLLAVRLALAASRLKWPRRHAAARLASFVLFVGLGVLLLGLTMPALQAAHSGLEGPGDNAFNTLSWRQNPALAFWRNHRPGGSYVLLSNQPDGVAFYAQHASEASPRRRSGPYETIEYPVESYASSLFASGLDVYLVWIEPDDRDYYYSPADLAPIASIETLYSGDGGSVFRLTPRPDG